MCSSVIQIIFKFSLGIDFAKKIFLVIFLLLFWLHYAACEILVPQLGIKPAHSAVEVRSRNHWTAWEVPNFVNFFYDL